MAKSKVDQIAEKGLKKLDVWYQVHTKKQYTSEKTVENKNTSQTNGASSMATSETYYKSDFLHIFKNR